MQVSEEALTEFIKIYEEEFKEPIDRDDAMIMARNLVMFYDDLIEKGMGHPPEDAPFDERLPGDSSRK
jgi:hypothetical protein